MSREDLEPQPAPTGEGREVWRLVQQDALVRGHPAALIRDMAERNQQGIAKYGTPLRVGNGRDPLVDAYQEALDLCVYLRQCFEEERAHLVHLIEAYSAAMDMLRALHELLQASKGGER